MQPSRSARGRSTMEEGDALSVLGGFVGRRSVRVCRFIDGPN